MKSFIGYTPHQILESSSEGGYELRMWHAWERREINTMFP
jgi:hypothetical protein